MQTLINQAFDVLQRAQTTSPEQHNYALVDGALQPQAWHELSKLSNVYSLLPSATDEGKSAVAHLPFLVALDGEQTQLCLQKTLALAASNHAATWLKSPLDASTLAARLALRLDAMLPDMAVVLRFADARVLPALHKVLDDTQAATFFCGISEWWYLQRDWTLNTLRLPPLNTQTTDPFTPPLLLSTQQENQLMDAAEPDAVLQLLAQHDLETLSALAVPKRHAFVTEQIQVAQQWGISNTADRSLFCLLALTQTPDFYQSEIWQQALQDIKHKRISLMQAMEQTAS